MLFKKKEKQTKRPGIVVSDNPTSIVSEQFRTIRTNIQFSMVDQKLQTFLVTSAAPESGKTTISANLAVAFASDGLSVLLVATDMRKPSMHKIFEVQNTKGMTTLLSDRSKKIEDVARSSSVKNLHYITSGPLPPNPAELISSNRMTDIIQEMKEMYDLVIFDTPPVLAVTDAQVLSTKVDGVLFVVPQGEVKKNELDEAADRMESVKANVLGSVLNKVDTDSDTYYYYGEE